MLDLNRIPGSGARDMYIYILFGRGDIAFSPSLFSSSFNSQPHRSTLRSHPFYSTVAEGDLMQGENKMVDIT
jgi:hypothetical protein